MVADFLSRSPTETEIRLEAEQVAALLSTDSGVSDVERALASGQCELMCALLDDGRYTDHQRDIISRFHNCKVGHFGVDRTLDRLREAKHDWPHMRSHVRRFIHLCPVCEKMAERNPIVITKPFVVNSLRPMEALHVDTIGPIEVEGCEYKYVLVVMDAFTRFVELFPTKTVEANEAASCLVQWAGRYGAPSVIRSDKGTQFANEVLTQLFTLMGVVHDICPPGDKQRNGIVKRDNKEVMRHLRAIIFDKVVTHNWVSYLPLVQRIMNASPHRSIGVSPAQLLLGMLWIWIAVSFMRRSGTLLKLPR